MRVEKSKGQYFYRRTVSDERNIGHRVWDKYDIGNRRRLYTVRIKIIFIYLSIYILRKHLLISTGGGGRVNDVWGWWVEGEKKWNILHHYLYHNRDPDPLTTGRMPTSLELRLFVHRRRFHAVRTRNDRYLGNSWLMERARQTLRELFRPARTVTFLKARKGFENYSRFTLA